MLGKLCISLCHVLGFISEVEEEMFSKIITFFLITRTLKNFLALGAQPMTQIKIKKEIFSQK